MNNKPISYHFIVYFQQYINPQSPLSFIHDSKKDSVQHFEFSDDQRNRSGIEVWAWERVPLEFGE